MAVDQAKFPLVSDGEISEINNSKTAASENIARAGVSKRKTSKTKTLRPQKL